VSPKFRGFIFSRISILKPPPSLGGLQALNRPKTLPQLGDKIKIQNYKGKKHEIQK
jgi:hypothetical protein